MANFGYKRKINVNHEYNSERKIVENTHKDSLKMKKINLSNEEIIEEISQLMIKSINEWQK